jgi:hypothetical protein
VRVRSVQFRTPAACAAGAASETSTRVATVDAAAAIIVVRRTRGERVILFASRARDRVPCVGHPARAASILIVRNTVFPGSPAATTVIGAGGRTAGGHAVRASRLRPPRGPREWTPPRPGSGVRPRSGQTAIVVRGERRAAGRPPVAVRWCGDPPPVWRRPAVDTGQGRPSALRSRARRAPPAAHSAAALDDVCGTHTRRMPSVVQRGSRRSAFESGSVWLLVIEAPGDTGGEVAVHRRLSWSGPFDGGADLGAAADRLGYRCLLGDLC